MDSSQMGEYEMIQSLPDEIRVALNSLIDTRTDFISAQFGDDERKTDRAYEAYHRADRACRMVIARHVLSGRTALQERDALSADLAIVREQRDEVARQFSYFVKSLGDAEGLHVSY